MKYMTKKGKMAVKKWGVGGKRGGLELKKYELATKIERLNGAKCRSSS